MNRETKSTISKLQNAMWKISEAKRLLEEVGGLEHYCESLHEIQFELDQKTDELYNLELK